jgi:hypothetical protein
VSNTDKILTNQSNSRPTISDLAEKLPASAEPDDTVKGGALLSFSPTEDPSVEKKAQRSKLVDSLDASSLATVNAFWDYVRKDGRSNYDAFRAQGEINITSAQFPNLCDPDVWPLVRKYLAATLIGRGMVKYDSKASVSKKTGSFLIGGSQFELKADGTPQNYPSTMRVTISGFANSVKRAQVQNWNK